MSHGLGQADIEQGANIKPSICRRAAKADLPFGRGAPQACRGPYLCYGHIPTRPRGFFYPPRLAGPIEIQALTQRPSRVSPILPLRLIAKTGPPISGSMPVNIPDRNASFMARRGAPSPTANMGAVRPGPYCPGVCSTDPFRKRPFMAGCRLRWLR